MNTMLFIDEAILNLKQMLGYVKVVQKIMMKRRMKWVAEPPRCLYRKRSGDRYDQFHQMLRETQITARPDARFQHWIDESLFVCARNKVIGNIPPDYRMILEYSIRELKERNAGGSEIASDNKRLLTDIEEYIDRAVEEFRGAEQTEAMLAAIRCFENMKSGPAKTLEEALQRILFWSSLFWQSGHKLIGLGRLDKILERYAGEKDEGSCAEILKDFLLCLHEHYAYKSNQLLGDTGQIIILGGLEENGAYYQNVFTYAFIRALLELRIPDPKLLLRVSDNMPEDLLRLAVQCIATGIGSPLLSNDRVVIPALRDLGYHEKDACDHVTSACWEPVSYGNSLEQNNLRNINFADAFVRAMKDPAAEKLTVYEDFLELYLKKLKAQVRGILRYVSMIKWEEDPLFTLFTDGCLESGKDIAHGGAMYNDYGLLSVGMGNAVDSLLNLKELVFERKEMSMRALRKMWKEGKDWDTRTEGWFGHDSAECIALTNRLIDAVVSELSGYRNPLGGKVKFGLSSPGYVTMGKNTGRTLDGRDAGEPLTVHISSGDNIAYTELVSFSAQLHYTGLSANANVVDYFVSPDLILKNLEKFTRFVRLSIRRGFFQMQMNVVSSDMLIEASKDPDKYPNLIVRVWGFSAYFKDLPEEYQQVLIRRALIHEGKAEDEGAGSSRHQYPEVLSA